MFSTITQPPQYKLLPRVKRLVKEDRLDLFRKLLSVKKQLKTGDGTMIRILALRFVMP